MSGAASLLADLEQIARNADVYNGPGGGICAVPGEHIVQCWLAVESYNGSVKDPG